MALRRSIHVLNGRSSIFSPQASLLDIESRSKTTGFSSPPVHRSVSSTTTIGTVGGISIFNLMRRYEDLIGLTEVKEAQTAVLRAERNFQETQDLRREKQGEMNEIQNELRDIRSELDKSSRGEDRYLSLLTREHNLIKTEQLRLEEFKKLEHMERDYFTTLSTRLRESHEKERVRGEKTKYWSIIGSVTGAVIGIVGTTINNRLRLREVKNIVEEASDTGKVEAVIGQLSDMVRLQQQQVGLFVSDLKSMLNNDRSPMNSSLAITPLSGKETDRRLSMQQSADIITAIKEQDKKMEKEMDEIKQMIATERGYSMKHDGTVVYVGPEMTDLLDQTEKNIDMKMKLHTLVAVVAVYGALAITVPVMYAIFRGS